MDFNATPQVESLLERIKEFNEEHIFPVEMDLLRALDEEVTVQTPRAYPDSFVELRDAGDPVELARRPGEQRRFHPVDLAAHGGRHRGRLPVPATRSQCRADVIKPCSFDQAKSGMSGRQPAKQRDKS